MQYVPSELVDNDQTVDCSNKKDTHLFHVPKAGWIALRQYFDRQHCPEICIKHHNASFVVVGYEDVTLRRFHCQIYWTTELISAFPHLLSVRPNFDLGLVTLALLDLANSVKFCGLGVS